MPDKYVEHLDQRARDETPRECGLAEGPEDARMSDLRRGWYWGTQAFSEQLLAIARNVIKTKRSRSYRSDPIRKRHDEKEAEHILNAGLDRWQLGQSELADLRGSHPAKLNIAAEIRANTSVSLAWIAQRLHMHSPANVSQQLRRFPQPRQ